MTFYRIVRAQFGTAAAAFSGLGAAKVSHRWNWAKPHLRAVYASDSLALACLEVLVHLRPLPRPFAPSVYFTIEIPEKYLERPAGRAWPRGWRNPVPQPGPRNYGTRFLEERRAPALVLPTAIQPLGWNALINPSHPDFTLAWVTGPHPYAFDTRLE